MLGRAAGIIEAGSAAELARSHEALVAETLEARRLGREAQWTDSIAVANHEFVNAVADANEWRAKLEPRPGEGNASPVREAEEPYGLAAVGAEDASPTRADRRGAWHCEGA